ncbi:Rv3654c family TadE-like protein [Microbacterium aureliae]
MPGSALAVGIAGAAAAAVLAFAGVATAALHGQRAAAAADAAALAAADAASGAITGYPCARAEQVAEAHGIRLASCDLDELVATVRVEIDFGPLPVTARARAGPPP